MAKFLLFLGVLYLLMQSNAPLKLFDEISGMESPYKPTEASPYEREDHFGDMVLDVSGLSYEKQAKVFGSSVVKKDILGAFPDFESIRSFMDSRVFGEPLKSEMLKRISRSEEEFITGGDARAEDILPRPKLGV